MKRRIPTLIARALLGWALLLASAVQASPAILVFGDSLAANYGIPARAGWPSLLDQRLREAGYKYQVLNASISGETTRGGLQRIGRALASHRPAIVILELGANDGLRGLPLDAARDNLEAIVRACREAGTAVLLVGMKLPPNYGPGYAQQFHSMYLALAEKHRLALVPFLLEGIADKPEFFQADGLHPTAQAQAALAETVWKALQPMLRR